MNALIDEFKEAVCPFKIYGVPCNQFGKQEPGVGIEILNSVKYVRPGHGFIPELYLLVKRDVNGKKEDELYTWLKVSLYLCTIIKAIFSLYLCMP